MQIKLGSEYSSEAAASPRKALVENGSRQLIAIQMVWTVSALSLDDPFFSQKTINLMEPARLACPDPVQPQPTPPAPSIVLAFLAWPRV